MKKVVFIPLALFLVLCAFLFPTKEIERQKVLRIAALDAQVQAEAQKFTPEDDVYVDYVNHPYPISGSNIFRVLLLIDAILLLFAPSIWKRLKPEVSENFVQAPYTRIERLALISLTAFGAVLRFAGANRDFWLDELATVFRYVRGSTGEILFQAVSSNNHLLNSLMAHATAHWFGENELIIRLPAILFGIAIIPVSYHLVRSIGTSRDAFLSSLLLTFSYHHIFFSQNARGYTAMLLGAILSTHFLILGFKRNRLSDWIFYSFSMLLSILSVLFGVFIFASHVLCVFLYWLSKRKNISQPHLILQRMFFSFGLVIYLSLHAYAFMIPDVLGFIFGEYRQAEVGWKLSMDLMKVVYSGLALGPVTTAAVLICGLFGSAGFISYLRREPFAAILLVSPIAITLCTVLVLRVGIFPRYFLFALPVAFLFLARGILLLTDALFTNQNMKKAAYALTVFLVLAGSAWMLRPFYQYPMQDFTGAKKFVLERAKRSEPVVAVGTAAEGYRYY
ncbi:glycosyltransferase family 39 protein, partial [bacterium]|nr:glycosyltransferase family 39 protein [bacterium]